jgi:hypothetical protein
MVSFDDDKTNPKKISDALNKGKMPIQGRHVFVK